MVQWGRKSVSLSQGASATFTNPIIFYNGGLTGTISTNSVPWSGTSEVGISSVNKDNTIIFGDTSKDISSASSWIIILGY